jgi:hypothetical protein
MSDMSILAEAIQLLRAAVHRASQTAKTPKWTVDTLRTGTASKFEGGECMTDKWGNVMQNDSRIECL